ncbi:hypothetical protein sos41_22920 [Alphaproteobacteria bacterium SO-S41]|nr:hypothetical protein sos41_22920 [Alphaproteobacteria bacterium SO-S41]
MFMLYVIFLLTLALLTVLGLVSFTSGAGPAALTPIQNALKPAGNAVKGIAGVFGIIAVIWGFWLVIRFIIGIQGVDFSSFLGLLIALTLITVGILAGYVSVAAYFGAPASGAGKVIDWFKRTFGPNESIVGIVALVFALWTLIEFILNRSGVYI